MAVDGKWNMTMSTPMGERKATLELKTTGGTLSGTHGDEPARLRSSRAP
jgi:hypothetical protein